MQVGAAPAKIELEVDETAKPITNRRDAAREHPRIGDDDDVGAELGFVGADEVVEVDAPDFFLPFENELDVDRQPAVLFQVRFDRLEVHEDLTLVVGRPARVDLAVADGRLEGRRFPQLQRIDGLHVVMPVEEDRRRAFRAQPVAVDDRIARGIDEAHVLQPDAAHLFGAPIGAAFDVGGVLRQRADARNREEPLELLEIAVAVHVDEIDHVVHAFVSVVWLSVSHSACVQRISCHRRRRPSGLSFSRWARTFSCAAGSSAGSSPS